MTSLHVSLLGRFAVELDGRAIEIRARASQSLFAYLILNREVTHRRELIAGKFWPDSDETNARNNLRHALWQIRSALGQDVFLADKVTVAVDPKIECHVDVDLLRGDTIISIDRMLAAAEQYHGDLLPGFYDDWVILEREQLRGTYTQLMERLLDALIEAKRWPEVSEWAERWIAMGHIPEPAFRALMIAHSARGDQAGVAAVYVRCVETLERELGVEPSAQTRALHEQLLEEGFAAVMEAEPARERYEVGEEIGRGGMGEVYRALDTWLEREVAIKVLSSEALGEDARERLLAEAQAAARLNHPNVVSVYDIGEMEGQPFIVMELVEGETLHEHRPENQAEMLAIILEICAALEHAHAQGIVHRDLKPENVMLAPDGMARLMDFGLASRTVAAPGAPEGTAGTVYYLAPEVLGGAPASPQSDLYALGVLLYEILTGEVPFTGEDPMTVIRGHLEAEPIPPSDLNPEIRPALEALILRLLSKRPADRPLSAASVAEVLEAVAPDEVKLAEPAPGEPPFKGLEYYDVDDAEIFFGREALVERLIDRLRDERFLAVIVGASGSGKSSIARAGLVPALSDGEWIFRLMTPTEQPLESLAEVLVPQKENEAETAPTPEDLACDPTTLHQAAEWLVETEGTERLLLVVDQLEELFTLCDEEEQRTAFIDNLLTAVDPEVAGPTVVVITLRADFYPHCAAYPALREALARNQEYIGPMNTSELRRAIEEPALRGGWKFQSGLVDLMLRDVRGEPGALPLLSHALLETWKRRSRRTLTLRGYAEAGGVRRAIARSAEQVYHQELSEDQRGIARNVFLRLTELGEGTEDTRRRVAHSELVLEPGSNGATEQVLATLAGARLITLSEEHVEVAHEALIREWPRLRSWLDEDREGLRIHRHLTEAAQAWEALQRDPGELYRGGRLVQAMEWHEEQGPELNPLEREFLEASQALAEQREAEREAQVKRLRRRAIYLGGALLVALAFALAAAWFGYQATQSSRAAQAANTLTVNESNARATAQAEAFAEANARATAQSEAERSQVEAERLQGEAEIQASVGLAVLAEQELESGFQDYAVLLGLEALERYPYTSQAERALGRAVFESKLRLVLQHKDVVTTVVWLSNGNHLLTTSQNNPSRIWDSATGKELIHVDHEGFADYSRLSPDGLKVVTILINQEIIPGMCVPDCPADLESFIVVWDPSTGEQLFMTESHQGWINDAAWSPSGDRFVTTGNDQTARVWDADTGEEIHTLPGHEERAYYASWSPGGDIVATTDSVGNLMLWDAATGNLMQILTGRGIWFVEPAWSPSGELIAAGDNDGLVKVWDSLTGEEVHTIEVALGEWTTFVVWSNDGERFLTTGEHASVWDTSTGALLMDVSPAELETVYAAGWSPSGDRIMVANTSGATIFDAMSGATLFRLHGHSGGLYNGGASVASWSPSGDRLATAGNDGAAMIWDLPPPHTSTKHDAWLEAPNWSPTGDRFTAGSYNDKVIIWDTETREVQLTLVGEESGTVRPRFSPSGDRIAGGSFYGPVFIWDAKSGQKLLELSVTGDWSLVTWSTDGNRIATLSGEGFLKVWDSVTGEELYSAKEPGYEVYHNELWWSPTGDTIVAAFGEMIMTWDASTGETIATFENPEGIILAMGLSPDGKRLATYDEVGVGRIWDAETGEVLVEFRGHEDVVWGLDWSPNGERIVTTGWDGTLRIWDAESGVELYNFEFAVGANLDWSPDGMMILTSFAPNQLVILPIIQSTQELIDYANECCVVRQLTLEDRARFGLPE